MPFGSVTLGRQQLANVFQEHARWRLRNNGTQSDCAPPCPQHRPARRQHPQRGSGSETPQSLGASEPALLTSCASVWASGPPAPRTTMRPLLSALLCLGLCLGHRMRAQAGPLPRPSLRAENGSLGPLGSTVTFRCRGSPGAAEYLLEKDLGHELKSIHYLLSEEAEVEFSISIMTLNDAGNYSCSYRTASRWSEHSDPLELVVTELYHPPSLSAWPGSTVAEGQNVSLQCRAEKGYDRSALYKDGEQVTKTTAQLLGRGSQASFLIPAVTSAHGGTYRCYSFQSRSPHEWSFPSDPLELRVTGNSKDPPLPHSPGDTQALTASPPNPAAQDYTVGNVIRLSLAGLVLILLGVLLAEVWNSCRGHLGGAPASSDTREGRAGGQPTPTGNIMSPALSILLCLGLCLGHRMRVQAGPLPRPSLRAENGPLGPLGRRVSFRCRGSPGIAEYLLEKKLGRELKVIDYMLSEEAEVNFSIPKMTLKDAGIYFCHYRTASHWSERSNFLELVVTERYHPPSLSAWPGSTVAEGQNVSLQCRAEKGYDRSALYKDGEQVTKTTAQLQGRGSQASFLIPAVTSAHGGTYRCFSFQSRSPHEWSFPSDPLELRVTGNSKDPPLPHSPGDTQALTASPPNPAPQDYTVGNVIRLSLAGLVLILLGVLLAEAWNSSKGHPGGAPAPSDTREAWGQQGSSIHKEEGEVKLPKFWGIQLEAKEKQPLRGNLRAEPALLTSCALVQVSQQPPSHKDHHEPRPLCPAVPWTVSGPQDEGADELPRPSLRAENGSLSPLGRRVTFRCRGSQGAAEYVLEKELGRELKPITYVLSEEAEVEFSIPRMTLNDAGNYSCSYRTASRWSERSDPLELVVTELYHPPSLSAWPGSTVAEGQNVSLQCRAEKGYDRSALYKDGAPVTQASAQPHGRGSQANVSIPAVTSAHGGTYRCYSFQSHAPHEWSAPSDPLELRVTDPAAQDYTVGNVIRLSLAGLVLILLGVLLAEVWNSCREPRGSSCTF
ncbi:paired immunoglobulin-like receptor B [Sminthopsis crassicaudata]|uniref:paired immunoglobulin-like receptor B n=1 Tax=Sminthopsis crassicaudata TaxID=9301 RepID=UPI003D68E3F7